MQHIMANKRIIYASYQYFQTAFLSLSCRSQQLPKLKTSWEDQLSAPETAAHQPPKAMDSQKLVEHGTQVLQAVANYWDTLRDRQPKPDLKPGDVMAMFPKEAPMEAEPWTNILKDVESHILAGNTHWQHPHFFAYFGSACSYPAVLADILSTGIATNGFSWISSPSCTEVEIVMLDWLARALGLPEHFIFTKDGPGGGIIQPTASDSTLVAVLGARGQYLEKQEIFKHAEAVARGEESTEETIPHSTFDDGYHVLTPKVNVDRLMMYCSTEAHSSVERAAMLAHVNVRKVKPDENLSLRGHAVEKAMEEDIRNGWIPFCIVAASGTTNTCAFDNLQELGQLSQRYGLWMHVDAAYAGCAAICPEFRHLFDGVELADSYNFNPNKWLRVNFDCSPMWFKDKGKMEAAFRVDPLYLKHENQDDAVPDFRHMQIALGRRFRSLKIWFVLRAFGIEGLRADIRNMIRLAKEFESLLLNDPDEDFELFVPVVMGLVCFRLKNQPNERTEQLLTQIDKDGRIHLVPSISDGVFYLRLSVSSTETNSEDIQFAYHVVKECLAKM